MASGDTLLIFTPLNNEPPASNFATPDTRNRHPVLDFDDTAIESAIFTSVLPKHYSGSGIDVYIGFSATTASINNVAWQVGFERIGNQQQDIDTDSFTIPINVNTVVPGITLVKAVLLGSVTDGANIDFIAVGDQFRVLIKRIGSSGSDTAAGDAELHYIELRET